MAVLAEQRSAAVVRGAERVLTIVLPVCSFSSRFAAACAPSCARLARARPAHERRASAAHGQRMSGSRRTPVRRSSVDRAPREKGARGRRGKPWCSAGKIVCTGQRQCAAALVERYQLLKSTTLARREPTCSMASSLLCCALQAIGACLWIARCDQTSLCRPSGAQAAPTGRPSDARAAPETRSNVARMAHERRRKGLGVRAALDRCSNPPLDARGRRLPDTPSPHGRAVEDRRRLIVEAWPSAARARGRRKRDDMAQAMAPQVPLRFWHAWGGRDPSRCPR